MKILSKARWLWIALPGILLVILAVPVFAQKAPPGGLFLRLVSSEYDVPVTRGIENTFQLVITNNSLGDATNVNLTSFQPRDWSVTFNPPVISRIPQNGVQTVDVIIKPPEDAAKGHQGISITAQATEMNGFLDIAVNVQGGTSIWLWIGAALAAVLIAGFVFVYFRMGRQ